MKNLSPLKNKKALRILWLITILLIGVSIIKIVESDNYIRPYYEKVDLISILQKNKLEEDDYKTLFYQTGLGKIAIDEILKDKNIAIQQILKFQNDFFSDINILCERFGIFTSKESIVDHNRAYKYGFDLAPYESGYILITKSTHSFGWRHGHTAIITDSEKKEVLEAIVLGQNSKILDINDWRVYPSFIMLRLKGVHKEDLNKIASFASENMTNLPYKLTVGLLGSKNPKKQNLKGTNCSHLLWYVFNQFGYDIDSNGALFVTPKDILNSNLFEVVQIYGVDPEEIWP